MTRAPATTGAIFMETPMAFEDTAQDVELKQWELNNLAHSRGPIRFSPGEPGYGPDECEECGAKMPAERRAWGFDLCVDCKSAQEKRGR